MLVTLGAQGAALLKLSTPLTAQAAHTGAGLQSSSDLGVIYVHLPALQPSGGIVNSSGAGEA